MQEQSDSQGPPGGPLQKQRPPHWLLHPPQQLPRQPHCGVPTRGWLCVGRARLPRGASAAASDLITTNATHSRANPAPCTHTCTAAQLRTAAYDKRGPLNPSPSSSPILHSPQLLLRCVHSGNETLQLPERQRVHVVGVEHCLTAVALRQQVWVVGQHQTECSLKVLLGEHCQLAGDGALFLGGEGGTGGGCAALGVGDAGDERVQALEQQLTLALQLHEDLMGG